MVGIIIIIIMVKKMSEQLMGALEEAKTKIDKIIENLRLGYYKDICGSKKSEISTVSAELDDLEDDIKRYNCLFAVKWSKEEE